VQSKIWTKFGLSKYQERLENLPAGSKYERVKGKIEMLPQFSSPACQAVCMVQCIFTQNIADFLII
jgi:hypothetical protein